MTLKITLKHENGKDTGDCASFAHANSILRKWSRFSHPTLGYDKIEFVITDASIGLSYQGRYDLQHWSQDVADLGSHVLLHLEYVSGSRNPPHMSAERYNASIAHYSHQMRERAVHYHDLITTITEAEYAAVAEPVAAPAPG